MRPRRAWFLAAFILAGAALGIGWAVRADRTEDTPVVPYDPLPRW
jgi:hypothetical protein